MTQRVPAAGPPGEAELAPRRGEGGLRRNPGANAGLPGLEPLERRWHGEAVNRVPAAPGAEVMLGWWDHRRMGPRAGALSEGLGEVGLGRWGEGRGSRVNKRRPEPISS